jgi:hypothetical protein
MANPRIFNNAIGVVLDEGTIPSRNDHGQKKNKKVQGDSVHQHTCFLPSKNQVAATISKCLPKQDAAQFEVLFKGFQCNNNKNMPTELSNAGVESLCKGG